MYRLALYYLATLLIAAVVLSFFSLLPFSPYALLASATVIIISCAATNYIFGRVFKAPANVESVYITALILALIISPPLISNFSAGLPFLILASVWAMAGKFIFAFRKKHIFLRKLLRALAPKPDIVFIMKASSKEIKKRKIGQRDLLSDVMIDELYKVYNSIPGKIDIDTKKPIKENLEFMVNCILGKILI